MKSHKMIAMIDYGLGNIHAFANIYKRLNIPAEIASTPQELRRAEQMNLWVQELKILITAKSPYETDPTTPKKR